MDNSQKKVNETAVTIFIIIILFIVGMIMAYSPKKNTVNYVQQVSGKINNEIVAENKIEQTNIIGSENDMPKEENTSTATSNKENTTDKNTSTATQKEESTTSKEPSTPSQKEENTTSKEPSTSTQPKEDITKPSNNTSSSNVTVGQKNAVSKAKSYLSMSAFSYEGLIEQLEFEKFTNEQAVYGAKNCGADWKEQAAKKAKSYLSMTAFSRDGLIDQLEFEGFTHEQAVYGVEVNGL